MDGDIDINQLALTKFGIGQPVPRKKIRCWCAVKPGTRTISTGLAGPTR